MGWASSWTYIACKAIQNPTRNPTRKIQIYVNIWWNDGFLMELYFKATKKVNGFVPQRFKLFYFIMLSLLIVSPSSSELTDEVI